MKKYSGFTLIELMMTISVIAIITAIALPSFEDIIRRNTISTVANTIVASLTYARSESADQGLSVQVNPIDGANWANGWQVIIDGNNDGDFVDGAGTDDTLRFYEGISNHSSLTLTSNTTGLNVNSLVFLSTGELGGINPSNATFLLRALACTTNKTYQRNINVSLGGITRVSPNNQACP